MTDKGATSSEPSCSGHLARQNPTLITVPKLIIVQKVDERAFDRQAAAGGESPSARFLDKIELVPGWEVFDRKFEDLFRERTPEELVAIITETRKRTRSLNAVANFKRAFDFTTREDGGYERPETGVAFLVVCDMLLTGFDAPHRAGDVSRQEDQRAQPASEHRPGEPGEEGQELRLHRRLHRPREPLKEALKIYSEEDQKELGEGFKSIESEVPVLEARYQRLLHFLRDAGVGRIEDFVRQRIEDRIEDAEALEQAIQALEDVRGGTPSMSI